MKHFYHDIQGYFDTDFADIYQEAVERAPLDRRSTFVEVGSWKGRSAAFMAVEIVNSGKWIDLWCVDTWLGPEKDGVGANLDNQLRDDPDIDRILEIFWNNLAQFSFVFPLRKRSVDAALDFGVGTIDFVMIDASHEWEDVRDDIIAWTPRLRLDGVLAGDDYNWPGVWRGVNTALGYRNVKRRGRCWVRK